MLERFRERVRREPKKDSMPCDTTLGVPFRPFEGVRKFYWPKNGEQPFLIPEDYTHVLLLRKELLLYGIKGYIDVISDGPWARAVALATRFHVEKPLGEAAFDMVFSGRHNEVAYREKPYIL